MTYALVELAVTSPAHGGVVSSVNFGDLVPLDVLDLVHRHVPGERHSLGENERNLIFWRTKRNLRTKIYKVAFRFLAYCRVYEFWIS